MQTEEREGAIEVEIGYTKVDDSKLYGSVVLLVHTNQIETLRPSFGKVFIKLNSGMDVEFRQEINCKGDV
jgi:hypothetical protein